MSLQPTFKVLTRGILLSMALCSGCLTLPIVTYDPWPSEAFRTPDEAPILYGADIGKLQESCEKNVRSLAQRAISEDKARKARNLAIGIGAISVDAVGGVTALTASQPRDNQATAGYILLGVGVLTKAIDLIIPQNHADSSIASYRIAAEWRRSAEERLRDLFTCMSVPTAAPCPTLLKEIIVRAEPGKLSESKNGLREKFDELKGSIVLYNVRNALTKCAEVN